MVEERFKTRIVRAMLDQEARVFVGPASFWRRVQIVLPATPRFFIQQDVEIASEGLVTAPDTGKGWGANRVYKAPPMDGDQQITFHLAPGQWLVGATETGAVPVTVILEYSSGPRGLE